MVVELQDLGFRRFVFAQDAIREGFLNPEKCTWFDGKVLSPTLPSSSMTF